jgi:hypothetical protein
VPLRDIDEFHRWVEREPPSVAAQRVARNLLAEVGDDAWRSPSVPVEFLSNQPVYEVREVALRVEGGNRPIQISYQHIYATNAVNVIAVTNQ